MSMQTITVARPRRSQQERPAPKPEMRAEGDEVLESLRVLRSGGDVGRVRSELRADCRRWMACRWAQVIRLLAWDLVSSDARRVLLESRDRLVGRDGGSSDGSDEDFAVRLAGRRGSWRIATTHEL